MREPVSHCQSMSMMGVCRVVCDLHVLLLLCHQRSGEGSLVPLLLLLSVPRLRLCHLV
jgi:hypothetical protein